ncbi:unnamed protein product [Polarella glacialis]|uniref:Alkaline ceramidase n=1 Tax=Polarella glacialis TaxID=89957 RepID=A0A813JSR8_POLGL|nr:unnamed protein product [Polarella glacialis]
MSIAVGSICFHASLRYSMQLLDELPMLWYVLVCTVSFLRRLRGWRSLELPAAAVALTLTTGILLTEQHSTVHEVFRGLMSCTFSVCLVVIGWGSTATVERLKLEVDDKRRWVPVMAERLHTAGFLCFVLSVMCWLADNYYCPLLRNLPGGLPYPHLHTWWHLLVALALYLSILICLQLYDRRDSEELAVQFRFGMPIVIG